MSNELFPPTIPIREYLPPRVGIVRGGDGVRGLSAPPPLRAYNGLGCMFTAGFHFTEAIDTRHMRHTVVLGARRSCTLFRQNEFAMISGSKGSAKNLLEKF